MASPPHSHPNAIMMSDDSPSPLSEVRLTALDSGVASDSGSSSSSSSVQEEHKSGRPRLGTRKSSGTIIVPRDCPKVELDSSDEVFDPDDARCMSPRRNSEDLEKLSQETRQQLSQHAKLLHDNLLTLFNRIEAMKEEHDKLDSNNKFLQKYIGDLMSTSKITSTGGPSRKK